MLQCDLKEADSFVEISVNTIGRPENLYLRIKI